MNGPSLSDHALGPPATGDLFLSRLTLQRAAAVQALGPLLAPSAEGPRTGAAHHLLWSLFADDPGRRRDFLWREDEGRGGERFYYVLSRRPPEDRLGLFQVETKAFTPDLAPGDRLSFRLRVNATAAAKAGVAPPLPGRRAARLDIVMARMRRAGAGPGDYGELRQPAALEAARDWMGRQGAGAGFHLGAGRLNAPDGAAVPVPSLAVESYRVVRVPRGGGAKDWLRFGVLDLSGELVIDDPGVFLARMAAGFGRGRGFGYGLMMIRRAGGAG